MMKGIIDFLISDSTHAQVNELPTWNELISPTLEYLKNQKEL